MLDLGWEVDVFLWNEWNYCFLEETVTIINLGITAYEFLILT